MATHLDLEEQEQLDRLKAFWSTYGALVTGVLLLAAVLVMAWNGWQYYQRRQAVQAAALYDELERAAQAGDADRVQRAFDDMKARFARTVQAQQGALLAARSLSDKGRAEPSRAALAWLAEHGADAGYQAIAHLRLASVLMDAKAWDAALKQLAAPVPKEFEALVADRQGDIHAAQGRREEAAAAYRRAWSAFGAGNEYRRLIEIKLNAVGVDPRTLAAPAADAAKTTP
ncbi:MAG: tetratricopeptide repeat protein [Xenophilus sp.]